MQINSNLPAVLNNAEEMKQKEHIYNILPVFKGWNTTAREWTARPVDAITRNTLHL